MAAGVRTLAGLLERIGYVTAEELADAPPDELNDLFGIYGVTETLAKIKIRAEVKAIRGGGGGGGGGAGGGDGGGGGGGGGGKGGRKGGRRGGGGKCGSGKGGKGGGGRRRGKGGVGGGGKGGGGGGGGGGDARGGCGMMIFNLQDLAAACCLSESQIANTHGNDRGRLFEEWEVGAAATIQIKQDSAELRRQEKAGAVLRVQGAGNAKCNGFYKPNGEFWGKPRYAKVDDPEMLIYWEDVYCNWHIWARGGGFFYGAPSSAGQPPVAGWKVAGSGIAPAPTVQML